MLTNLVIIFVMTYMAITMEQQIKINKTASALVGAGLLWTVYAISSCNPGEVGRQLDKSIIEIAQIIIFLMGTMTIVEVVDAHNGFEIVTRRIRTARLPTLLWLVGIVSFFLSAILDNLTTTIVMISLIRKLLPRHKDRLFFAGIIVIVANSGGAWSPIGDVTTTMLWIGGQITTQAIMKDVFLPSLVSALVPLGIAAHIIRKRDMLSAEVAENVPGIRTTVFERNLMFFLGLGILIAVPVFKTVTHLPPFLGMMFGLGILWLVGDTLHRNKNDIFRQHLTLTHALSRIDMNSIVFFVGILLAVALLEHTHILTAMAQWLDQVVGRLDVIVLIIGAISTIVDNVPLVAASRGMYNLSQYPQDHFLWTFLAYCAGTGGSILITGSAAGVAAMGLENIHFFWYVRKISGMALIGYLAGAGVYLTQEWLMR